MIFYKFAGNSGFKILEDLRLKITPPNEFNDPFEITPLSKSARPLDEMLNDARINPEKYREIYDEMVRDGAFSESFERFITGLPTAMTRYYPVYKKMSKTEMANRDITTLDEISQRFGVLCLSKTPLSIPMWSYYGDHHRGVAIGIEADDIGGLLPGSRGLVKYRKGRAKINPFLPPRCEAAQNQRLKVLFTKSFEWKHEQEYRRVFQLSDLVAPVQEKDRLRKYFLDIPSGAIKEIIFGCRVEVALENKIRHELQRRKQSFSHVGVSRLIKHNSKFQLKIVPS